MKTVYISFLLHGNMCYDRYTKQEIREKFPKIYATGVRAMHKFPEVTAHIDFPGLTLLSLKHHAPWFLEELRPLVDRRQVVMVGCQYAASHALCADEEADLLASGVTMRMLRDELQPDTSAFFPQEIAFHPQSPYIMKEIGARYLIVMPAGWQRPRRVKGIDGSEVLLCPLDLHGLRLGKLEEFYDRVEDGAFVMTGGDFELLGNVQAYVDEIKRLAEKGKIIRWTTVERYEREVGVKDECDAPNPFGQAGEDREPSPSFSRWVGDPEDMIWHGHAVEALDAVRSAGFAKVAARVHGLGEVAPPLAQAWTTEPDNAWDHKFEEVGEYPETEAKYLTEDGTPTLLSRAWHHLLIGLNSDSSGWFPWQPRTRHRNIVLQASRALSNEVIARFAREVARKIGGTVAGAKGYALAINPLPARTAEISLETETPMAFAEADGRGLPTEILLRDGRWIAKARVALPAYGYKLLGLVPGEHVDRERWTPGREAQFAGRTASLAGEVLRTCEETGCRERPLRRSANNGIGAARSPLPTTTIPVSSPILSIVEGDKRVEVSVAPFRLSDPSGVAPTEEVAPTWRDAHARARHTMLGADLEVFTELAWAVWLRLVIGLREDRVEIAAEVHVDMPRRIGPLKYDPNGLLLQFKGEPGEVYYDVPYATIRHQNAEASFIAAQRFAAIESAASFGLVALGGNQSFKVVGKEGILAANLGASTQGRPDTRPQCILHPDGSSDHKITSGGDPFYGAYSHRFALLFADRLALSLAARRLRTAVPLVRVEPDNGPWPAEQGLLQIGPETAHITAFRVSRSGCDLVFNDLSGRPCKVSCQDRSEPLAAFGVATVKI